MRGDHSAFVEISLVGVRRQYSLVSGRRHSLSEEGRLLDYGRCALAGRPSSWFRIDDTVGMNGLGVPIKSRSITYLALGTGRTAVGFRLGVVAAPAGGRPYDAYFEAYYPLFVQMARTFRLE